MRNSCFLVESQCGYATDIKRQWDIEQFHRTVPQEKTIPVIQFVSQGGKHPNLQVGFCAWIQRSINEVLPFLLLHVCLSPKFKLQLIQQKSNNNAETPGVKNVISDWDVYIRSLKTGVNEWDDGFRGMEVPATYDLCSPVISFSPLARWHPGLFLYLQKNKRTRQEREREESVTGDAAAVCAGVAQEHRRAACGGLNTYVTEQTLRAITVKKK